MKSKGGEISECERLQIIYEALENCGKIEINDLIRIFKGYNVKVSVKIVQGDLETLSRKIDLKKTRSSPIKYCLKTDEYKDLMESIEKIKKSTNFKILHQLKHLEKIYKKEIRNYTEILIGQLLRFDLRPQDIIHPWAFYMLMEESVNRLEDILESSPSIENLLNDTRFYRNARKFTAIDIGVDENIFPKKNPYNLIEIIKNKRHPLFKFRDQYLNWRNNYEK